MRIFVAGDTHGNTEYLTRYLFPKAADLGADALVQVGDFGYWEHQPSGVEFLDQVDRAAEAHHIPLYWVRGNHDNLSHLQRLYRTHTTDAGFIAVRPHVLYIPDGLVWTWEGTTLRAFGGAYSIDKQWRLDLEAKYNRREAARFQAFPGYLPKDHTGTVWFPDEEMTDEQMTEHLAGYPGPVDVIFSHDKPMGSMPTQQLKNLPGCSPNQQRLQRALVTHKPFWWLHGHLHHFYTDLVRSGDDNDFASVVGLSCDDQAAGPFWKPWHSWCILDLAAGTQPAVQLGAAVEDQSEDDQEMARSRHFPDEAA